MTQVATFIDAVAIASRMGLSVKHVRDRVVHLPTFPAGIKLGYRTMRYSEHEVNQWINQQRVTSAVSFDGKIRLASKS